MHRAGPRVHADVGLQTEVPLVSLLRLMHLRVAFARAVLGRRRRMHNGRIDDRARLDLDAL